MPGMDTLFGTNSDSEKTMLAYYEKCREVTEELGLEVFESTVSSVMSLSEEEVNVLTDKYPDGGLRLYACNGLLGNMPNLITATAEETEKIHVYMKKAVNRMARLGVKCIVFGSGWHRRIPDGVEVSKAEEIIFDFINYTSACCENEGVTLVLEPLNKNETNWCNSVAFGAEVVRKLDLNAFKLLADGYHMAKEQEDLSVIEKNSDIIRHCHIAAEDRSVPGKTQYEKDFLYALKKAGYDGVVSVECGYSDFFKEAPEVVDFMKRTVR